MEEENNKLQADSPDNPRTRVGFPEAAPKAKKSGMKLVLIIIIVLSILASAAWFVFGRGGNIPVSEEPTPTPFFNEQPTSMPIPTETEVDKSELKIQVLNGTGIAGGAGTLKTKLEALDFSNIEVGNASPQNYTSAEVTFSSSIPESVEQELTDLLEDTYQDVKLKTGSTTDFDIKIITGYPQGYSPSPTKVITPTLTPKPTTTGSITPTINPSITPTKTPTTTP
ncbi:MAG: hypothetical protein US60_C0005G0016 [Microgenomates group bacterium GW2011_GWC1_37_8]|uniref:Putative serine/threonine-protein kinase drkB n=1 Tax=Candidatus Woesebacteria bacterium GW2011_GWB1_38_8 TaxID=1618570 RepID=A0A0G0LEC8_9BACT|nr:MAG: hypothetical protein US60_C0005G0016 [Microgenomates group bacterium GW2011_GWC1_37_8]KKQ86285.1 MAG: putative serine/threonine-protein kinase drkB [Candidatus Woesebacteria bacterium GW2011_GWB1_38_8]